VLSWCGIAHASSVIGVLLAFGAVAGSGGMLSAGSRTIGRSGPWGWALRERGLSRAAPSRSPGSPYAGCPAGITGSFAHALIATSSAACRRRCAGPIGSDGDGLGVVAAASLIGVGWRALSVGSCSLGHGDSS